ncbi:MAG: YicC family protein, partial [Bacteroidetes bacterium]
MTGYGRETQTYGDKTINIEIRSLNSKYSDLRLKIPQNYKEKEHEIRRVVTEKTFRGKIDMLIETTSLQGDEEYGLNKALFRKYFEELNSLTEELGAPREELTAAILRLPNVVATDSKSIDEKEWKFVLSVLDAALEKFYQFRLAEGSVLEEDLKTRTQ